MIKIYGSQHCPYCTEARERFSQAGIEFEFMDFADQLIHLKTFIRQRDVDPQFEEVKKEGRIGIPALLLEDGTWIADWRKYLHQQTGKEVVSVGQACGLDGKGC